MNKAMLALAASAVAIVATQASAATIVTDRAAFNALGAGQSYAQNFNSVTAFQDTPFTFGPLTATGAIRAQPAGTAGENGNVNGTGWLQYRLDLGTTGTLTSTTAFRLLGFDFRGYQGDEGEVLTFITNTGETGTFALPSTNTAAFIGFVFNAATTSFTIAPTTGGGDASSWFGIDNLQGYTATAATAVPEPATWGMMLAGFGLMGVAVRRQRNVKTGVTYA